MDLKILLEMPPWQWPRATAKKVLETLIDRRANKSDRLAAAELAGDFTIINDDLAGALMAIVSGPDEPEPLRAKAAISFGPVLEQGDLEGFIDPGDIPISEDTFGEIQELLHTLYQDRSVPKEVRRRILEASVRASADWHQDAIREAYATKDKDWMLTAVFSMRYVRGFDAEIVEALNRSNPEIRYEAVEAAGMWGLGAAWPHIDKLLHDDRTPPDLLLAAIGAVATIRPADARKILADFLDSSDEEAAEAADEAIATAKAILEAKDFEEDASEWIN